MVSRNQGAGTRTLIDGLLKGIRPQGYWNRPRSHNAVAASVAQGRSDWGIAIRPVADALGLGFIPFAEEHYDSAVMVDARAPQAMTAFRSNLTRASEAFRKIGFVPA